MKVAIVCDWLVTIGGAEKVLEQMLKCFPYADLFAVVDFLPKDKRGLIKNKSVTTSFIQELPKAKTKYRTYLPLMPLAIEQLDVANYDVVISSSHAVAKGIITGPDQLHICYCHSPIRYAWDLQHQYLREAKLEKGIKSWIARWILHKIRIWDSRTSNNVDYFIANSKFIARRIFKIYRREATVIYPPVKVDVKTNSLKEEYYLTASRLVPYKRVDLIVSAFKKLPETKLVVIGDGPEYSKIAELAKDHHNIQIMGYQEDSILREHMAKARAFIFAAEEDFGIVPVEAQAYGVPVIAYAKGGALETVNVNSDVALATGCFFKEQTSESLVNAIHEFENISDKLSKKSCIDNAQKFSEARFKEQFSSFVLDKYQDFISRK